MEAMHLKSNGMKIRTVVDEEISGEGTPHKGTMVPVLEFRHRHHTAGFVYRVGEEMFRRDIPPVIEVGYDGLQVRVSITLRVLSHDLTFLKGVVHPELLIECQEDALRRNRGFCAAITGEGRATMVDYIGFYKALEFIKHAYVRVLEIDQNDRVIGSVWTARLQPASTAFLTHPKYL